MPAGPLRPADEGRHAASAAERWSFSLGRVGIDSSLAVHVTLVAAEQRASFAAAVRLQPDYAVVLVAADLPMPRRGLELRGPGIWADHIQPRIDRLWASRKSKLERARAGDSVAAGAPAE